jgi:plasmid maintenance system antidote protein VapI
MEEKLRKLMKHEGINSTKLAEMLGIQASGISHIMSGRNKPSYDFIVKLLSRFPQINPDWLLIDKGPMYRDEIKSKAQATSSATPVHLRTSDIFSGTPTASPASTSTIASGGFSDGLFSTGATDATAANSTADGTRGHVTSFSQILERDDHDIISIKDRHNENQNGSGSNIGTGTFNEQSAAMPRVEGVSAYGMPCLASTSSIERIVVFFCDKTFTEYQPSITK